MALTQDKSQLASHIQERRYREILRFFSIPNNAKQLDQLSLDPDLQFQGMGLQALVGKLQNLASLWKDFEKLVFDTPGAQASHILQKFRELRSNLSFLPGRDVGCQFLDWLEGRFTDPIWVALEKLEKFWAEYGADIENWIKQNNLPHDSQEVIARIQSDFPLFEKTAEFQTLIHLSKVSEVRASLVKFLSSKPTLAEAALHFSRLTIEDPEIRRWKAGVAKAQELIQKASAANTEEDDLYLLPQMNNALPSIKYFKEHAKFEEILGKMNARLNTLRAMRQLAGNGRTEALANYRAQLPPQYSLANSDNNRLLLDELRLVDKFKQLSSLNMPSEKTENEMLALEKEFQNENISAFSAAKSRFDKARIRLEVLDQIRQANAARRKNIGQKFDREKSLGEIFRGFEAHIAGWILPEFQDDWAFYQTLLHKKVIQEKVETILKNKNPQEAALILPEAEKVLAQQFSPKNPLESLKTLDQKGKNFQALMASMKTNKYSLDFRKKWEGFFGNRDNSNKTAEDVDLSCFKADFEKSANEILASWKMDIKSIRPSEENPGLFFVQWDWPHKEVVNKVYYCLLKDAYPKTLAEGRQLKLLKETVPEEHENCKNQTFVISNSARLDGCVLTVWPAYDLPPPGSTPAQGDCWIKKVGPPQYFKFDPQKRTMVRWPPA